MQHSFFVAFNCSYVSKANLPNLQFFLIIGTGGRKLTVNFKTNLFHLKKKSARNCSHTLICSLVAMTNDTYVNHCFYCHTVNSCMNNSRLFRLGRHLSSFITSGPQTSGHFIYNSCHHFILKPSYCCLLRSSFTLSYLQLYSTFLVPGHIDV